jgi:hypothetical protein
MPSQNDAMRELQSTLVRQFKKLNDALEGETDADRADAILREMQEVSHRVALAGSLLFAGQAKELDEKVAEVAKGVRKVNAAIAEIKNLQAFLDTVSDFLVLVDDAIDLAKTLV